MIDRIRRAIRIADIERALVVLRARLAVLEQEKEELEQERGVIEGQVAVEGTLEVPVVDIDTIEGGSGSAIQVPDIDTTDEPNSTLEQPAFADIDIDTDGDSGGGLWIAGGGGGVGSGSGSGIEAVIVSVSDEVIGGDEITVDLVELEATVTEKLSASEKESESVVKERAHVEEDTNVDINSNSNIDVDVDSSIDINSKSNINIDVDIDGDSNIDVSIPIELDGGGLYISQSTNDNTVGNDKGEGVIVTVPTPGLTKQSDSLGDINIDIAVELIDNTDDQEGEEGLCTWTDTAGSSESESELEKEPELKSESELECELGLELELEIFSEVLSPDLKSHLTLDLKSEKVLDVVSVGVDLPLTPTLSTVTVIDEVKNEDKNENENEVQAEVQVEQIAVHEEVEVEVESYEKDKAILALFKIACESFILQSKAFAKKHRDKLLEVSGTYRVELKKMSAALLEHSLAVMEALNEETAAMREIATEAVLVVLKERLSVLSVLLTERFQSSCEIWWDEFFNWTETLKDNWERESKAIAGLTARLIAFSDELGTHLTDEIKSLSVSLREEVTSLREMFKEQVVELDAVLLDTATSITGNGNNGNGNNIARAGAGAGAGEGEVRERERDGEVVVEEREDVVVAVEEQVVAVEERDREGGIEREGGREVVELRDVIDLPLIPLVVPFGDNFIGFLGRQWIVRLRILFFPEGHGGIGAGGGVGVAHPVLIIPPGEFSIFGLAFLDHIALWCCVVVCVMCFTFCQMFPVLFVRVLVDTFNQRQVFDNTVHRLTNFYDKSSVPLIHPLTLSSARVLSKSCAFAELILGIFCPLGIIILISEYRSYQFNYSVIVFSCSCFILYSAL